MSLYLQRKFDKDTLDKYVKEIYTVTNEPLQCEQFMKYFSILYCVSKDEYVVLLDKVKLLLNTKIQTGYDNLLELLNKNDIKNFWFLWYSFMNTFRIKSSILCFLCNTCTNRSDRSIDMRIYRNDLLIKVYNLCTYPICMRLPISLSDIIYNSL
jgi:hypothetical protein